MQKPLLIVEMVGLAGVGKTTLARALVENNENFVLGAEIELRKLKHLPIFLSNFPRLLPEIYRGFQPRRWFTWDEIKTMVYLKAWPGILKKDVFNHGKVVLLDHGPVFKLATLLAFGPKQLRSKDYDHWWDKMFEQWAEALDMIIYLDAPASLLVERINSRSQKHAVKGKSKQSAYQFLARYKDSYRHVLTRLRKNGRPVLFHFDTRQASIEQIAEKITYSISQDARYAGFYTYK